MAENINYSGGDEGSGNDEYFGLPEVTMTPIDREESARKSSHSRKSSNKRSGQSNAQTNAGLIFALILIFLVATSGVLYFFWDDIFTGKKDLNASPESEISKVITDQEDNLNEADDSLNEDVTTDEFDNTEDMDNDSNTLSATGTGEIIDVTARTQRTYVVIGSFIDEDLARDYGNRLARQGVNTKLIMPYNNKRFYRLSIADFDTITEAVNNLDDLKSTYGSQAWVLRY